MSFIRRGTPREYPFPGPERPRTATIRGTPPPAHLPADPDDEDTIVVDPPTLPPR